MHTGWWASGGEGRAGRRAATEEEEEEEVAATPAPHCHRPSHRCSLGLGLDTGDLLDGLESLLGLLDLLVDPVPHGCRGCLLVAGLQVLPKEWLLAQ